MADQGLTDRAIDILAGSRGSDPESARELGASERLLLARLELRDGNVESARQALIAIATDDAAEAELRLTAIGQLADLEYRAGRPDFAEAALANLSRITDTDDLKQRANLLRAGLTFAYVDPARALAMLQAITEANPTSAVAWRSRLNSMILAGQEAQAAELLGQAAAQTDDATLDRLAEKAALLTGASAYPELRPFAVALVNDADDRAAMAVLEAYTDAGESSGQGSLLPRSAGSSDIARRLGGLVEKFPRSLQIRLALVNRLFQEGAVERAAEVAIDAAAAFPLSADAARVAASTLAAADRWAEAEGYARQWGERDPLQAAAAMTLRARALLILNRPGEAVRLLEGPVRAIVSRPEPVDPQDAAASNLVLGYAAALIADGKTTAANALLNPLLAGDDETARAWQASVMNLAATTLPATAAADWLVRLEGIVPADAVQPRTLLAEAWGTLATRSGNDQYASSARRILGALQEREDAPAEVGTVLALQHERIGDFEQAEALYRNSLERLRTAEESAEGPVANANYLRAVILNNLAMVLSRQGVRLDEAVSLSNDAISLYPDVGSLHDTLAFVLWRQGQYADALPVADKAVELEPQNLAFQVNRAQILLDAGRRDEAVNVIDAVAADPRVSGLDDESRLRFDSLRRRLLDRDAGETGAARSDARSAPAA